MSTLLEKASERVVALPPDEQDAITSQILASLAGEDAWKKRSAEKLDVICRMAREALEEDERGEMLPLGDLLYCGPGLPGKFWRLFCNLSFDSQRDAKRVYRLS